MIPLTSMSRAGKSIERESRSVVARDWHWEGRRNWRVTANGYAFLFKGNGSVLELTTVMVIPHCTCT